MLERYIAAIGGSAGMLDPLKTFFDHVPNDNVSYVILRHLSIHHQSRLKEILAKHSKLRIVEVTEDTPLESNTVYLMPAYKYMMFGNDIFKLVDRPETGPNRAIDVFLHSLAWTTGPQAIAVILSGAGMDGTKGVQDIKDSGGMVIAQAPESCEQASMPRHAINSGCVDFTALPKDMPRIIMDHVQH